MALPRNCLMGRVPITRPTRDLRAIIAKAKVHGLSCWPWVGVTKGTPQRWADICSEMAHASGLAFIDVEAPADFHAFMAEYRVKTPENLPVLCTCAGVNGHLNVRSFGQLKVRTPRSLLLAFTSS